MNASLVQLRQMLREKFPGLATRVDELPASRGDAWTTGITKLDERLGGGFPKSAISEIVAPRAGCASALLMLQLLRRAVSQNQFTALVDGRDSFDAAAVEQPTLDHLLWIRCHNADDAVKATDLVLRDGNLPVVLLDLMMNPVAELRKVPSPTWYRFQRIIEQGSAILVVLTPAAMIFPAEVRVRLRSRFGLEAIDADQSKLLRQLDFHVEEASGTTTEEPLRKTA